MEAKLPFSVLEDFDYYLPGFLDQTIESAIRSAFEETMVKQSSSAATKTLVSYFSEGDDGFNNCRSEILKKQSEFLENKI